MLLETGRPLGAAVRQQTVRKETTMARHGTLPEFMYQRQRDISDKPVSLAFDEQVNTADAAAAAASPTAELDDDEADKYDESSDEEVEVRPVSQRIRTPGPNPLADMDPLSRIWTPFNKAIISF